MASVEFTVKADTILTLSPAEGFIVRKALKQFSKLAVRQTQADMADAIVAEMEKD